MKLLLARCTMAALVTLAWIEPGQAHEMFLRPAGTSVPVRSHQTVRLVTGTFDKSENSITRDRMADVSILAHGKVSNPPLGDWIDDDRKTYSALRFGTGSAGTYVLGVSTRASIISMSAQDFVDYLKHDGVVDALAEFERRSDLPTVRERYSKHVRTYVQVGDIRSDDYARPLGYPVEILLDRNPTNLRRGDRLGFRVFFQGRPLANQIVRASHAGFHGHDAQGGHLNAIELRTDAQGWAELVLNRRADWYLSLIHMQRIDDPQADYESNWATATFSVK